MVQYIPSAVNETNILLTGACSSEPSWTLSNKAGDLKKNDTVSLNVFSVVQIHKVTDLRLSYAYNFLKFMKMFTKSAEKKHFADTWLNSTSLLQNMSH